MTDTFDSEVYKEATPAPTGPFQQRAVQPVQTAGVIARQSAEVQAAVFMAKQFPRDVDAAIVRINKACSRKSLAEDAEYQYPRGGEKVTGPSIRLAEVVAQNWGNIDSGVIELEQRANETVMMAYAWDLETNTRDTKVFTVPHIRETKKGNKPIDGPRDIYEVSANMGARRKRACILAVIPGDVIDGAVDTCRKTLKSAYTEPLEDLIRKMLIAFESDFQVPKDAIEKTLGYPSTRFTENDMTKLRKIYLALKDGVSKREDYFDLKPPAESKAKTRTEEAFQKDPSGGGEPGAETDGKKDGLFPGGEGGDQK